MTGSYISIFSCQDGSSGSVVRGADVIAFVMWLKRADCCAVGLRVSDISVSSLSDTSTARGDEKTCSGEVRLVSLSTSDSAATEFGRVAAFLRFGVDGSGRAFGGDGVDDTVASTVVTASFRGRPRFFTGVAGPSFPAAPLLLAALVAFFGLPRGLFDAGEVEAADVVADAVFFLPLGLPAMELVENGSPASGARFLLFQH